MKNLAQIVTSPHYLIQAVFPNVTQHYLNYQWLPQRAIFNIRKESSATHEM